MIDLTLWSSALQDDRLLKQITMPGSHDATIYDGSDFSATGFTQYVVSKKRSITQSGSIGDQCRMGSRFFDIRLKEHEGAVRGYHQTAGQGGVGATSQKVLDDVDNFLKSRGSEFVILRISHTGRGTDIHNIVQNHPISKRLYKGTGNLANTRIGDLRGKAICIFDAKTFGVRKHKITKDDPSLINQVQGVHAFYKYKGGQTFSDGVGICGCFKGSPDINVVLGNAVKGADEHACHGDDHLFLLYWQQTYGYVEDNTRMHGGPVIEKGKPKLTGGTHQNTPAMIKLLQQKSVVNAVYQPKGASNKEQWEAVATTRGDRMCLPNIISYDFINPKTSEEIVLINDPGVRHYVQRRLKLI